MTRRACICRPNDPEGWYREDCPTHGREAEEARAETGDAQVTHARKQESPNPTGLGL